MKKATAILVMAATLAACNQKPATPTIEQIGRHNITIDDGRLTPEALWAFGRLSDVQVSPDGKQILYGVSYYSIERDGSNRQLFTMNADGSNVKQITDTPRGEQHARWVKNGTKIAFLRRDRQAAMQIFEMNPDGSQLEQITYREGGINDFLYAPDNSMILYVADIKYGETVKDKYPDLDKTQGMLIDDLMYKHWDEWVRTIPHPFIVDYDGNTVSNERDILAGEPFECPMKPFGGTEQLAFSPDGKTIAYTCRKKTGAEYAASTNSDIYLYDIAKGETTANLSEGMMGYDMNPTFSPDGTMIAWESMEREGNESDKVRLMVMELASGKTQDLSEGWDQSVASLLWAPNSEAIYLTSVHHGTTQIYKVGLNDRFFRKITNGMHDYLSVALAENGLIAMRQSMSMPNEIYLIDEKSGNSEQISFENKHILDQVTMGDVVGRWIKTTDNKEMLAWIIYPPHFDPSKKYPALLYCQGGPQSPVSQFWSYRWNFQMMAANDYIIIAPNRRGLYGFGQEWLDAISGDYGGQCMRDLFTAIDYLAEEPYVDNERLGAVGASFGGFSVFWMAGHHDKRFKAFIAHDGMFNLEQQYLETEEMWFVNQDLGGPYWIKGNKTIEQSYANSPHLFVDKWDTPILVIHGEKDYRILASQSMAAFNAARLRDVPAELLLFPDENHWVLKPQNGKIGRAHV